MENFKVFLNHLYFSLVIIFLGMIGLYIVLRILDGLLSVAGTSFGISEFSIRGHIGILMLIWALLSLGLTIFLTYLTIKNRPVDRIVYTKRIQ